jgi:uncharacterized protein DUF4349
MICVAGCSAASGGTSISGGAAVPVPGTQAHVSTGSSKAAGDVVIRQVVTTGSVVIRSSNPISAADKAAAIVDQAGGRVDDRTQTAATKTAPADARLTLRIPESKLTQTLVTLKKVGTELSISESTDDVTTKSEDLNARITALQTSITRLLALEAKATDTSDVIQLENDISTRQGELESLQAQQRYLNDQIAMATIKLHLIAPSVVIAPPGPPSAATAFFSGLSGFGVFFTWAFLVLTYLLPWLVLAAVVWIGIVVIVRARRKRRAAGASVVTGDAVEAPVPVAPPPPAARK